MFFKDRFIRFCVMAALIGIVAAGLAVSGKLPGKNPATNAMAGVQIGGPFTLVDQDGKTVTEKDFSRTYKLIYFGFTFCPSVCPTELQRMTGAMEALGKDGDRVQPIFITVDPERDTPKVMHSYVRLFSPRLIGLTGSREQVDHVIAEYRVYAAKAQQEGMSDYTMDHSSFTYLMSPDDKALAIYKPQDKIEDIAKDIVRKIQGQS